MFPARILSTGLGLFALLLGFAPSAQAQAPASLEAVVQAFNPAAGTLQTIGLNLDVRGVVMQTPGGLPITLAQAAGAPLPGRLQPGFVGCTVFADIQPLATGPVALGVTLAVPETVLIGPLTANAPGTDVNGRALSVLGVPVRAAVDARLDPFRALIGAFDVDVGTIPVGSPVALEGYYGDDGVFYAQVLEADQGVALGGAVVAVTRARCRTGQLEAQGSFSSPAGNFGSVQVLDQNGLLLGAGAVNAVDGTWRVRLRLAACPGQIRARHVETGALSPLFTPAAN